MNILVTGGLGFIGHHVVELLEQQGHTVAIMDNETDYGIIAQDELSALVRERKHKIKTNSIYFCDVADPTARLAFELFKPDTVIHLASFPRQKVVNANPTLGSKTMIEGLLNLLELSVEHKVNKFVYISSSMVYGNFDHASPAGISEDHVTHPIGQYGIMKLAGEWLVQDYAKRTGIQSMILRPSAVYGPRDVEDRVISRFMLAAMRDQVLQVNGAQDALDFTHVDDAARGIVQATISNRTGVYNITRGRSRSLLEAAELIIQLVGSGRIQVNNRDNSFPSRGQLNTARAQVVFGFAPCIDIEQGFENYLHWLDDFVHRNQKTIQPDTH